MTKPLIEDLDSVPDWETDPATDRYLDRRYGEKRCPECGGDLNEMLECERCLKERTCDEQT